MPTIGQSVSQGTFLPEHLIAAFMAELPASHRLRREYDEHGVPDGDAEDLIDALIDALNAEAPEGSEFGPHPGNSSDFGFWPTTEAGWKALDAAGY